MNSNERKEEVQSIAALYALGALDQQDARMFETHLADELDSDDGGLAVFKSIVATIGLSAPERQPPPSVRDRLRLKTASSSDRKKDLTNQTPANKGKPSLIFRPDRYRCL